MKISSVELIVKDIPNWSVLSATLKSTPARIRTWNAAVETRNDGSVSPPGHIHSAEGAGVEPTNRFMPALRLANEVV